MHKSKPFNKLHILCYCHLLGKEWLSVWLSKRHGPVLNLQNSEATFPSCFVLGKGSSSVSSDVSSSTDHTPTKAQKNVATSEGRHRCSSYLFFSITELAECERFTPSLLHESLSESRKGEGSDDPRFALASLLALLLKLVWWDGSVLTWRQLALFCQQVTGCQSHCDILYPCSSMAKWYDYKSFWYKL